MTTTTQIPLALPTPSPPWRALPVLVGGGFLCVLDFFIVNVALPSIRADLGGGSGAVEWLVAGYGLSFAALLFFAGRLGDAIGHRRVFGIGLALFLLASLGCSLAPSAGALVASRVLQGAGGALLMPAMLALIGALFPGRHRTRALAVYGIVQGVAAAGGQLLGGALIGADIAGVGWRVIFAINVPVAIALLIALPRLVPATRDATRARAGFDVVGVLLMTATVAALILPLIEAGRGSWPTWSWILLAGAPLLLVATIVQQRRLGRRGGTPIFPGVLLSVPALRNGLGVQLVFWCGQASFYLVLALLLQDGLGLTPLQAGLVFGVLALAYVGVSFATPMLTGRLGRRVIAIGAITLLLGYGSAAVALPSGSVAALLPGLALVGAGQALALTPLSGLVLAHATPEAAGAVSSALATMQQVGNCLGVAVVGLLYFTALPAGAATAFGTALAGLSVVAIAVLALTRLLPRSGRGRSAEG